MKMKSGVFIYIGITLNLIQYSLAGALLGGHLKNIETNDDPLLSDDVSDGKQTGFEPSSPMFLSTNNQHGSDQNRKLFPNHRESYGPLHQPKTYKYPYPLISSSYASMKIQGANKYNGITNGKDNVITHRFPSNNNNIDNLLPNYNPNWVTTTTSKVTSSAVAPKTSTTIASSSTTTTTSTTPYSTTTPYITSTTPRTTTIKVTSTTSSREEADSLFNKFLMEIFKTTDFDNIDNFKEEKVTNNKDTSPEKTELVPPKENSSYEEHFYPDASSESQLEDSFPVENTDNFYNKLNLTTEYPTLVHNSSSETYVSSISNTTNPEFVYVDYEEDKNYPTNQSNSYAFDYYTDDYVKPNIDSVNLTYEKPNEHPYTSENNNFYQEANVGDNIKAEKPGGTLYSNENSFYQNVNIEDNSHRNVEKPNETVKPSMNSFYQDENTANNPHRRVEKPSETHYSSDHNFDEQVNADDNNYKKVEKLSGPPYSNVNNFYNDEDSEDNSHRRVEKPSGGVYSSESNFNQQINAEDNSHKKSEKPSEIPHLSENNFYQQMDDGNNKHKKVEKPSGTLYPVENNFYQDVNAENYGHKKTNEVIPLNKTEEKVQFNAQKVNITIETKTESPKSHQKVTTESNILVQLLNQDKIHISNKTKVHFENTQNTSRIIQNVNRETTTTPKSTQPPTSMPLRNHSEANNYMISVSLLPPVDRPNQYQYQNHYLQELHPPLPQQDLSKHVYYQVEKAPTGNAMTKTISNNVRNDNNQHFNSKPISSDRTSSPDSFRVPSFPANEQNNTEILFKPLENVYLLHDEETNDKKKVVQGSATLSVGIPVIPPVTGENKTVNLSAKVTSKIIISNTTEKLHIPDYNRRIPTNDKILSLNSQPMYHQLPTDLTPPLEDNKKLIRTNTYTRPSWELKPGHYTNERLDYTGPLNKIKHRIPPDSNLPNILPQFRPNAKISYHHPSDTIGTIHNKHLKRPLPPPPPPPPHSPNVYVRPISSYYEKLQPPRIQQLPLLGHSGHRNNDLERRVYEKESSVENKRVWGLPQELSRGPPKVPERYIPKKGNGSENEVSTLQMIKSMQNSNINSINHKNSSNIEIENASTDKLKNENEDFPLYVVYPTNHSSLSLNIFNTDKSTVVVGKRGEQPILPSEIQDNVEKKATVYAQSVGHYPHHSMSTDYPVLSDFPYPIERPNVTLLNTDIKYVTPVENPPAKTNEIPYDKYYPASTSIIPAAALNSGIVVGIGKEVPAKEHIAIAYTPTEPPSVSGLVYPVPQDAYVKMDMAPHYGTGVVEHNKNEFTVSAIMHTHPQNDPNHNIIQMKDKLQQKLTYYQNELHKQNHRIDYESDIPRQPIPSTDFQAPFQASISIDSPQEHWSIVRNKHDKIDENDSTKNDNESSTKIYDVETATTNSNQQFDFENFKPQLFGGFKPIIKVTTENDTILDV